MAEERDILFGLTAPSLDERLDLLRERTEPELDVDDPRVLGGPLKTLHRPPESDENALAIFEQAAVNRFHALGLGGDAPFETGRLPTLAGVLTTLD